MKKTININLGGLVFSIDEDAFDRLSKYIDALKQKFTNVDEQNEIIQDIEYRFAELFNAKINKKSLDYARFLSHIRFTIERILTDTLLKNDLIDAIKESYPISYEIAEEVSKIIETSLDKKVQEDEIAYIAMHIERFRLTLCK